MTGLAAAFAAMLTAVLTIFLVFQGMQQAQIAASSQRAWLQITAIDGSLARDLDSNDYIMLSKIRVANAGSQAATDVSAGLRLQHPYQQTSLDRQNAYGCLPEPRWPTWAAPLLQSSSLHPGQQSQLMANGVVSAHDYFARPSDQRTTWMIAVICVYYSTPNVRGRRHVAAIYNVVIRENRKIKQDLSHVHTEFETPIMVFDGSEMN